MTKEQLADLEKQLRDAIQKCGLTLNEIERRCGVSHAVLSRFLREERSLTLPIASKLCTMLGLRLTTETATETAPEPEPKSTPAKKKPKK